MEVPPAPKAMKAPKASPGMERFAPETGTLGLARDALPQVQADHHGPLVNFLAARGIAHEVHMLDPAELKPTQAEFSPEKVRALAGRDIGDGSILVSQDGYVLDGHHRWLAKKKAGEPIKAIVLQAPVRELIDHVKEFPSANAEKAQGEAAANAPADQGAKGSGQEVEADAGGGAAGAGAGGHAAAVEGPLGRGHTPLSEGGKPFATTHEASKARKLLPHMRVVRTEGGFALAPKTPAQLAAEERAAARLSQPKTSGKGVPIPAHAFIAAEGGLRREEMSDSGFDKNVRVGNRTLFAAAGKGLTIAQATEKLQQAHYLPEGAGHNQAFDLIRKSVSTPQYNPEGWEQLARAEAQTRFEDHLKAQQEHDDPLTPLPDEYLAGTGADKLTPEQHDQLQALIAAAEAHGVDTEAHLERAAVLTQNGTAHEYHEAATSSLEADVAARQRAAAAREGVEQGRPAAGPASGGSRLEVPGEQGARRSEGKGQENGLSWERRPSGTLALKGDPARIREILKDIPGRSIMVMDGGYMIGRTQVDKALRLLEGRPEKKLAKPLSVGTAPGDAEPITIKDGVVHIGKHEAIDFDSGEPVKVKAGASDEDIKKALRDAGAISRHQKFYWGDKGAAMTVSFDGKTFAVKSIEDAQDKWNQFRQRSAQAGGGARDIGNGVEVKRGDEVLGRISYNGRFHPAKKEDLLGEAPNESQQAAAKLKGESEDKTRQQQANAPDANGFRLTGSDRKADEDPDQTPMFSRGTEPFYSALSREVDAIGANAMPAEGWANRVKGLINAGKVKADEVEWSGLNDWLKMQPGKVTKDQISQFLRDNGVQVKEVTLGAVLPMKQVQQRYEEAMMRQGASSHDALRMWEEMRKFSEDDTHDEKLKDRGFDLVMKDGQNTGNEIHDAGTPDGTKYGSYTLPGGTNYREVLLTLPPTFEKTPAGRWANVDKQGNIKASFDTKDQAESLAAPGYSVEELFHKRETSFNSSHWDEPNVLAHIRLNDRTDADGKRVLFVEELQSDWAQAGRKKGFAQGTDGWTATRLGDHPSGSGGKFEVRDENGNVIHPTDAPSEYDWWGARSESDAIAKASSLGKIPAAPFVSKTDAWLSLAMKRVIKMAADEGYDRVAFVNGEQSADRYDLSKQISRVRFEDNNALGVGRAKLEGPHTDGRLVAYDLDGKQVIEQHVSDAAKELPDLIGKEAAKKLLDQPGRSERTGGGNESRVKELKGLDLKVGGEGMKSFYDKIVPTVAKDVLKKIGGDGLRTIELQIPGAREGDTDPLSGAVLGPGGRAGENLDANGFDITPAMREKAAGGLPLFRRNEPAITSDMHLREADPVVGNKRAPIESRDLDRVIKNFDAMGMKLNVADTIDQLPKSGRERIKSEGIAGVRGMYDPATDKVWVVRGNLGSAQEAVFVGLHEAFHRGFARTFGEEAKSILHYIDRNNKTVQDRATEYIAAHRIGRTEAIEEVLADLSGAGTAVNLKGWGRLVQFLKNIVARIAKGLGVDVPLSDKAVMKIVAGARRAGVDEEHGGEGAKPGNTAFSRADAHDGEKPDEAQPPKPYTGPGAKLVASTRDTVHKLVNDSLLSAAPMSAGSDVARAVAKDYANAERLARWQWTKFDDVLRKNFTEAERKQMWEAADEQNVLMQKGEDTKGKGLDRLNPAQRKVMDTLHDYGEGLLQRARDVGMFKGEGLPYWTPRMAVMIGADGEYLRPTEGQTSSPDGRGFNVTKTAGSLKQRKHLTAEDTEAAMKGALGDGAQLVRDIRTMPLAMARLERAIAGRELINQIKEIGDNTGTDTTSTTGGSKYFTLDHPAFKEYRYRPDVNMSEARDKHLWEGLMKFAADIGVSPERVDSMRGKTWGYATRAGEVVTRFGGPESVLTHELGHQLDFKYGLADMLTRRGATAKELRALADLRYEGLETSDYFKKYVRKGTEKIANMVHAYVHLPERFKEVAPATYKAFTDFLDAHPELAGLKKIKPSLVLERNDTSKRPPGEDFDVLPLYISRDFEGPLKAILSEPTGELYKQMMNLKSKSMGLIMYSPLIHNAVEWGRALPIMPGKVLTFRVYFEGNKIKNDPLQMAQAIKDGMVPIGHRGQMQDITGIMEDPSLAPGRSWTAKLLGGAVGAVHSGAGTAVKKGVDAAGDFWHNTLLWDRVGDLQAGIYGNMKADLTRRGMDEETAGRLAAHFANRYAGALPNEAMSANARKIANFVLFSRSFTMGNLGVMKDMLTGFPPDIAAQIQRDAGDLALKAGKSVARRKAIGAFALDIALMYAGNALMQSALDYLKRDKSSGTIDTLKDLITPWQWHHLPGDIADKLGRGEIEDEYLQRFQELMAKVKENPLEMLASPFESMSSLTPNSGNEPGKEDRIHYDTDESGTRIYVRAPFGKVGEEFKNWMTSPLETLLRKQGTIMRPITQTIENDKGFGQRVYNPDDKTWAGIAKNVGRIVWNFMAQQVPADSVQGAVDWAQGHADDTDKLKALGPLAGVTFSKGAPGGPEVGEMYHENKVQQGRVADAMPDVRRALKINDVDKAIELMEAAGMSEGQIRSTLKKNLDPSSRLSGQALKKYYGTASEESKRRMENYGR